MSSYLPTGSTAIVGQKPPEMVYSEALAKAKEIAARLTGKPLPTTGVVEDRKRVHEESVGDGSGENHAKRQNVDGTSSIALAGRPGPDSQEANGSGTMTFTAAPRSLKTTLEFIIPGYKVGLVIGARGETLKRIERDTDTKITFDPLTTPNPADMPERRVYVIGLPDDCENAKGLILEKIEEPSHGPHAGLGGSSTQPPVYKDIFGNPLPSLQFYIPNPKVGLVIGRGGETIRDLQERSGAKIYIAPDSTCAPNQTERLVSISGTDESIQHAKLLMDEIIEGSRTLPGGSADFNKAAVTLTVPDNMVGLLIGKRGENFKMMIQQSRARIVIDPPTSNGTPTRYIYISGVPESVTIAQQLIHEKLAGTAILEGNSYYAIGSAPSVTSDPYASSYDYSSYYYAAAMASSYPQVGAASVDPNAAAAVADPYAAYYQQYYGYDPSVYATAAAQSQSSTAADAAAQPSPSATLSSDHGEGAVKATKATTDSTAASYTEEQLESYYQYYYNYYLQAGCDLTSAASAATAAMVSAGLPAHAPKSGADNKKENDTEKEDGLGSNREEEAARGKDDNKDQDSHKAE